jgi:hypothetical protein
MLALFQRLQVVLEGSFPTTAAQELEKPSADGTHTTLMRGDEKGTVKARSARAELEPANAGADGPFTVPGMLVPAAEMPMATQAM